MSDVLSRRSLISFFFRPACVRAVCARAVPNSLQQTDDFVKKNTVNTLKFFSFFYGINSKFSRELVDPLCGFQREIMIARIVKSSSFEYYTILY